MSQFRALTIQSGVTTQIQPGNELLVGAGVDTDSTGALTLGSTTATSIVLGGTATTAVTIAGSETFTTGTGAVTIKGNVGTSGNPNFDFSGSTGSFATSSGTNTLNGNTTISGANTFTTGSGAVTVNGNTTFTGSTTVTIDAFATAGVVHNSSGGLLSTSLIVDADVSATANIAVSKLAAGTAGQLLLNNATPTPTWTTVSGDATLSASGHMTNVAIQGNPVSNQLLGSAQDGYVLTWDNADGYWRAESAASSIVVTLSGDVTGESNANTVVKINGASVPVSGSLTTGNVLQVSGASALTYAAVNLAGGANFVTGNLPVTNIAPGTDTQILQTNGSTPTWVTFSQDATVADSGVVTVVSSHGNFTVGGSGTGNLTVNGTSSLHGTTTVTTGDLVVSTGNISTTAGTITSAGLLTASNGFTVSSGTITLTPVSTGVVLSTSGVFSGSNGTDAQLLIAQSSGVPLWKSLSGDGTITDTGVLTITQAAGNFEVKGNLKVDGTETVVGTSTFQADVSFDGNVTIADGYTLTVDTITSNATHDLTLEGATGFIDVPTGMTLRATGSGQIIATSSTGTTALTVPFTTTGASTGAAVYVSSNDTVTATNASAIASSYCVGFVSSAGFVATDGLVTPIITGGTATAGQVMYLDAANAGQVTATAPSGAGDVVAPVGFMKDATTMIVRVLTPVQL